MIVEKSMNKDPERRYQNMSQLAADLRTFQRRVENLLADDVPKSSKLSPPLLFAGALVLVTVVVWLVWSL